MSFLEKLTGPISRGQKENKVMPEPKEKNWEPSETEGQLSIDVFQTPADIVLHQDLFSVHRIELEVGVADFGMFENDFTFFLLEIEPDDL